MRDIMPTILDSAGIAHSEEFDGRKVRPMHGKSVLELFKGTVETPYAEASQVGYELFGLKAYFSGEWKILLMQEPFGKGDWELYNIKDDPAEMNDLSDEHPEKLKELVALWEQYKKDNDILDISYDLSDKV